MPIYCAIRHCGAGNESYDKSNHHGQNKHNRAHALLSFRARRARAIAASDRASSIFAPHLRPFRAIRMASRATIPNL
jgi:hypothetical protein